MEKANSALDGASFYSALSFSLPNRFPITLNLTLILRSTSHWRHQQRARCV